MSEGKSEESRRAGKGGKKFPGRFVDPLSDWGFKLLFGTERNKDILIGFLNTLLPDKQIMSIEYSKNENLGVTPNERKAIFDVSCTTDSNERIALEMQNSEQKFFEDRCLYYSTFLIQEQARKGKWDYRLTPVYMISIVNFAFAYKYDNTEKEKWISKRVYRYSITEEETGKDMTRNLTFISLEVAPFDKKICQINGPIDKWLYLLKNLATLTERPAGFEEKIFTRLFEAAETAGLTKDELKQYEHDIMNENDYRNALDFAREKGMQKGLQRGMQRGIAKVAKAMIGSGMDADTIASLTGLSKEQINDLGWTLHGTKKTVRKVPFPQTGK